MESGLNQCKAHNGLRVTYHSRSNSSDYSPSVLRHVFEFVPLSHILYFGLDSTKHAAGPKEIV